MRTIRWTVIVVLVLVALAWIVRRLEQPGVAPGSTLDLPLEGSYVEAPGPPLLAQVLGRHENSFLGLISELRKAERDSRLGHVVLEVGDLGIGWGKAQELRDAILALRAAQRHPVALLSVSGFGANLEYYVASAAEKVYLVPGSGPPLLGLSEEFLYLGGLWDKLDVSVFVAQAGRYKGAAESISGHAMSDDYRVTANALLDSVNGQFLSGIAQARGLSEDEVRKGVDLAPSDPKTLEALKLIDGERTHQELLDAFGKDNVVEASDYAAVDPKSVGFRPQATFALVYGAGNVTTGEGTTSRTGRPVFAADTVIDALQKAADDDSVRAIVLRIDSPGGGSFPAERMWRAVRAAREKKPVVVSCSDMAASAAYYVSSAADAIVAEPGTLTGSIGVFAVRPAFRGLLQRFGVGVEVLERAPHAELNLLAPDVSPETAAWMQGQVREVYDLFLSRVAEGRKLEKAQVEQVAEGRVWSGAEAREHGLVDILGGVHAAVDEAKRRVGLAADVDVRLAVYPRPKPLAEQIRDALGGHLARVAEAALPLGPRRWQAAERVVGWLAAVSGDGAVMAPPVWIEIH
jgi:protease-4